jgi:hypothetical protein
MSTKIVTVGSAVDRERGASVEIHPAYVKLVRDRLAAKPLELHSYQQIATAAKLSKATVLRFFNGRATDDTARKICDLAGMPYPIISMRHHHDHVWIGGADVLRRTFPEIYADLYELFRALDGAQTTTDEVMGRIRKHAARLKNPEGAK